MTHLITFFIGIAIGILFKWVQKKLSEIPDEDYFN